MFEALITLWRGLKSWLRHALILIPLNVFWAASIPTIVLCPLLTTALFLGANRIAYQQPVHPYDLLAGARRYAWVSLRWGLITGLAVLTFYRDFYHRLPNSIRLVLWLAGAIWLMLQIYVWPLLLEQRDKKLWPAVRNALLLGIAAPAYTISLLFYTGFILLASLSLLGPFTLLLIGYFALVGNMAVIDHLRAYGRMPDPKYALS